MSVTLEYVVKKLSEYEIRLSITNPEAIFKGVRLLCGKDMMLANHMLYVGKASMLSEVRDKDKVGLIIINDCNFDFSSFPLNVAELSEGTDFLKLFNDVQNIFYSRTKIIDSSAELLNSLIKGRGLKYIVQLGSEILGNPIILMDSSFKLLATSTSREVADPSWNEMVSLGYCPQKYITEFKRQKNTQKVVDSQLPVFIDHDSLKSLRKIVGKIIIRDTIVGYLTVFENDQDLKEEDIEITRLLCDVVSSEMQKNKNFENFSGVMYEYLITDLLDEKFDNRKIVKERVKSLQWDQPQDFYLITADIPKSDITFYHVEYLKRTVESFLPYCKPIYYDENLCVLLNLKKPQELDSIKSSLAKLFKENNLTAGMSLRFADIMDIKKYYEQSKNALRVGRVLKRHDYLYDYDELYIYELLTLAGDKSNLEDFCHPGLFKILAYDKANGTDYYNTLHTYLIHGKNKIRTAEALYVHRNTMVHRINKISEITGMNLEDGEDCYKLFLSYKIMEL